MSTLRIYLFGNPKLVRGPHEVTMPSKRAWQLLAYLATHQDRGHSREMLAELFWSDANPSRSQSNFRNVLYRLRKLLDPVHRTHETSSYILTTGSEIRFNAKSDHWLDIEEFERLIAAATEIEQAEKRISLLERATALYTGPFMDGYYEDWVLVQQERLQALYLQALERLVQGYRLQKRFDRAVECAQRILNISPLQESVHRELMYLHALSGNRPVALQQYERCRDLLKQELGMEPLPETRALCEEIQAQMTAPALEKDAQMSRLLAEYAELKAPFIGRRKEWEKLLNIWENARAGRGCFVFIAGEAGIGKSRLCAEYANWVTQHGALSLVGRCYDLERLPYQPVGEALSMLLNTLESAQSRALVSDLIWAELAKLWPELLERFAGLRTTTALARAEVERQRLWNSLTELWVSVARHRPLVLKLGDLHWADEVTLEYLHHLARHTVDVPLVIVGTYRPEDISEEHPLNKLRTHLSRQDLCEQIDLDSLSPSEVQQLLLGLLSASAKDQQPGVPQLIEQIFTNEGTPFFIVETIKSLAASGALWRSDEGRWNVDLDKLSQHVPTSVRDLIQSRVQRLSPLGRRVLEATAIIGQEITTELLSETLEGSPEEVLSGLEELERLHLLSFDRNGSSAYQFNHEMIAKAVYAEVSAARRRYWHERVAQALERQNAASLELAAARLAHHFTQADRWPQAASYYQKAGERAKRILAFTEALEFFERALRALQKTRTNDLQERRFEILFQRSEIFQTLSRWKDQEQDLKELLELARKLGDDKKHVAILLRQARVERASGQLKRAYETAHDALKLSRRDEDSLEEANALLVFGRTQLDAADANAAQKSFEKALKIYRAQKYLKGQADALTELGGLFLQAGDCRRALDYYEEPYRLYHQLEDTLGEIEALMIMGITREQLGQSDRALEFYDKILTLSAKIGFRREEGVAHNNKASVYWNLCEYQKALDHFQQSLSIWREVNYPRAEAATLVNLGTVYCELEQWERALDYFAKTEQVLSAFNYKDLEIELLARRAIALVHQGQRQKALESSRRAVALFEKHGSVQNGPLIYLYRARVLNAASRESEAKKILKKACEAVLKISDGIRDPLARQTYLEKSKINREILMLTGGFASKSKERSSRKPTKNVRNT